MTKLQSPFHQKYFYLTLLSFLFFSGCAQAQNTPAPWMPETSFQKELVSNSSFEKGNNSWNIPRNIAAVVSGIAHSGTHSLHYADLAAQNGQVSTQPFAVQAGQQIYTSLWVKTKDISSTKKPADLTPAPGLKMGVTFFDSNGKAIKTQAYSHGNGGREGTLDWMQLVGKTTVPQNASSATVDITTDKNISGQLWVDDVQTWVIAEKPLSSIMLYPNYRGMTLQHDAKPWKFLLQYTDKTTERPNTITVKNMLCDRTGKVLFTKTLKVPFTEATTSFSLIPPANLPTGSYQLQQTFIAPTGNVLTQWNHTVRVVAQMPGVYVDGEGFTVVDGKRFFPLGVYVMTPGDEGLKRIADGGFNTVLSYKYGYRYDNPEEYLADAHKYGLKVIYSLKDMYPGDQYAPAHDFEMAAGYIKKFRDNPAILSWYISDEKRPEWLPQLHQMYQNIVKLDPNHPAYLVYNHWGINAYYHVTDVWGMDPYPVGVPWDSPGQDLQTTTIFTAQTTNAGHGAKGVWTVPQIMDWGIYYKDHPTHPPTLDEMRNQAFQAIIQGATGLIFYSYFDLKYEKYPRNESTVNMDYFQRRWEAVSAMAKQVQHIIPAVLENNEVALQQVRKGGIYARALKHDGKLLILLANPLYKTQESTFVLPQGWAIQDATQGEIKSTFADGKITLTLPSVGSGVFYLVKK